MSPEPEAAPADPLVSLVLRISDLAESMGEVVARHDRELAECRDLAAEALSTAFEAKAKASLAVGALTEQVDALETRLSTVHEHLLRTLNRRYTGKETA